MTVAATIEAYYDALRAGDPLAPFFLDSPDAAKFGLSERLDGHDAIADGLRDQTETTREWVVESSDLVTGQQDDTAWFADSVFMGWTDVERGIRFEFDTRWSGTLVRVDDESSEPDESDGSAPHDWRFAAMHVSTTEAL
ncbi:nuclear transport factor 2 family protein [Halomarina salina]|uniref:Nuclear transport factor 2 family protein n=1 Tax=Halomarina salina TaxID=1872699 RepID=A0ABD5RRC9_9EURY|nr:nuclear transport factor 2 family protein [Halomarina salina]